MAHNTRILIVEDDLSFASFLRTILEDAGYSVNSFNDPEIALKNLGKFLPHLIITDLKMPKMDGITFIEKAKEVLPNSFFIVITAFGTIPSAVEAIKKGALDYITKPLSSPDDFLEIIARAINSIDKKIFSKKEQMEDEIPYEILFAGMQEVYKLVREVSKTDTTVILYGETGTGKSEIARAIHRMSGKRGAFVEINCASIPESLVESELFGYEKGAFSGAIKDKPGKIELAKDGTLFLDEIGELTLSVQAKFLRVLQDKTFERLGGLNSIKTNARFITATNRDLKKMIREGKFKEDLYFRLNVFPITIFPLRLRRDAIFKIAEYLIEKASLRLGKGKKKLSHSSKKIIETYDFPGNIRELESMIERAVILSENEEIELKPETGIYSEKKEDLKTIEKKAIVEALKRTNGNKKLAASILGISLRALYYKIKEYGLEQY